MRKLSNKVVELRCAAIGGIKNMLGDMDNFISFYDEDKEMLIYEIAVGNENELGIYPEVLDLSIKGNDVMVTLIDAEFNQSTIDLRELETDDICEIHDTLMDYIADLNADLRELEIRNNA